MDDKNKKPEEYVERIRKDSFTDFLVSKQYKELVDTCDDLMNRKKMGRNDFTNIDKALEILCTRKIPNYLNYTMNRLGGGDKKDALKPQEATKDKFYKKYPPDKKGWGKLIYEWFKNNVLDNSLFTTMSNLLGWLANDGSTTYFPAEKLRSAVRATVANILYQQVREDILSCTKEDSFPGDPEKKYADLFDKLKDKNTVSCLEKVLEKRFDKLYNLVKKKIQKSSTSITIDDLKKLKEEWANILSKDTEQKIKLKINYTSDPSSNPTEMFTLL